jgi:L-alanine-DL-glutamate epimerase-like enolase superfamily enzyme
MNGISAIDIALWDRWARVAGRPLHQELGGSDAPTVPTYASGGYYADGKGVEDLAEEVAGYVAMGFNSVKIKAGAGTLREEEQRTAKVREALGSDRQLMLDMYIAWDDLETALSYVEMYQQFDPYWIEDPFPPDDLENYARLAERIPQPVAAGEFYYELSAFRDVVERKAARILQAEAPRCGGVTGWNRVAAFAALHGVDMCPDWYHQIHVHLVSTAPNGLFVEYFPDDTVFNFGWLVDNPLEVLDGALVLPQRPGLGFDFLEEAVGRYALPI